MMLIARVHGPLAPPRKVERSHFCLLGMNLPIPSRRKKNIQVLIMQLCRCLGKFYSSFFLLSD